MSFWSLYYSGEQLCLNTNFGVAHGQHEMRLFAINIEAGTCAALFYPSSPCHDSFHLHLWWGGDREWEWAAPFHKKTKKKKIFVSLRPTSVTGAHLFSCFIWLERSLFWHFPWWLETDMKRFSWKGFICMLSITSNWERKSSTLGRIKGFVKEWVFGA